MSEYKTHVMTVPIADVMRYFIDGYKPPLTSPDWFYDPQKGIVVIRSIVKTEEENMKEESTTAPEKEPDHNPQFNPNGFMLPPPGPACFLYGRAETDSNKTPVHVDLDEQPAMVGVRQSNGALVYSEQEKTDYQVWYSKALPKLPPLDFEGEIRTLDHWNQALNYAYQKYTGYAPPFMGGDTLVEGRPSNEPGVDLGEKIHGAASEGDTNPVVPGV